MRILEKDNNIILEEMESFDIEQILECGQCFHFEQLDVKEYAVVAKRHLLHIKQIKDQIIFFNTSMETFQTVWRPYFDLDRNYNEIKSWLITNEKSLLKRSGVLEKAITDYDGIRILNQDFFETLISFIISQNKQIPHIKQIINTISIKYGDLAGEICGKSYYHFPRLLQLANVTESELRLCKTGFRAPYIVDACEKLQKDIVLESRLLHADLNHTMEELMLIKGVGIKVASCVALFSLSKRNVFPIDVWVKRIMEKIYFEKETKKDEIASMAEQLYGSFGGYAQQYLFYYARENNIKVDER